MGNPGKGKGPNKSNSGPVAQFRKYERPDGSWLLTDESTDPDGNITSRTWTDGEGRSGTGVTFEVHPKLMARSEPVRLVVRDNKGAVSATEDVIQVRAAVVPEPPVNQAPVAGIRAVENADGSWMLSSDSTDPEDGVIASGSWEDSEGHKVDNALSFYLIPLADARSVRVVHTVRDSHGLTASADVTIAVRAAAVPEPEPEPEEPPIPEPVPIPEGAEFIIGRVVPSTDWRWFDDNAIAKGHEHGQAFPLPSQVTDWDAYVNLQYYDQGLRQYRNYHLTGDPVFLGYARKVTDSWYAAMTDEGTRAPENSLSPRNMSLAGLMLRALDGRPEMWPWITADIRNKWQVWIGARLAYVGLYFGVRDGGLTLLHTAQVGATHPDSSVRAEFRDMALRAARDYYVRLQAQDGGWYWQDDGSQTKPGGVWEQGFMVGLLLEGMIATHQLTNDPAIAASILKGVDHLWTSYQTFGNRPVPELSQVNWRATPYFTFTDGTVHGEINLADGWDRNTIREARQRNTLIVHAFGYAILLSDDPKYRAQGDEIFAATYGGNASGGIYEGLTGFGPLTDGLYSLADFRPKESNQAYRSAGRNLAWRQ